MLRPVIRSPGFWIMTALLLALSLPGFSRQSHAQWIATLGVGPQQLADGNLWTPLTALFVAPNWPALIILVAVASALFPVAEHLLGVKRSITIAVVTGALGVVAGASLQATLAAFDTATEWYRLGEAVVDPLSALTGLALATSAAMPVLWRRRVRAGTWLLLLLMLLYSGAPQDIYRVIAGLLGMAAGALLVHRRPRLPELHPSSIGRGGMSAAVALLALGPLVAGVMVPPNGPLSVVSSLFAHPALPIAGVVDEGLGGPSPPISQVLGFSLLAVLLVSAYWIRRGRRLALWVAVVGIAGMVVLLLVELATRPSALDFGEPVATGDALAWVQVVLLLLGHGLVCVALVALRRRCAVVASLRSTVAFVLGVATAVVVVSLGYAVAVLVAWEAFDQSPSFLDALLAGPGRMLPAGVAPDPEPFQPNGLVGALVSRLPAAALSVAICVLLWRACARTEPVERLEPAALRGALLRGGDGFSAMSRWDGVHHWRDAPTDAVIAYGVAGGCAITLGGVIGAPVAEPRPIVARFIADQQLLGRTAALYSVPDDYREVADSLGWTSVEVAAEALVDLEHWNLQGKRRQALRTALSRADREGVRAVWTAFADLTVRQADEIVAMSELWVADRALPEMRFTLGGVKELGGEGVRLMLALDPTGRVLGVTSWLPSWSDGELVGYTLDFMRRSGDAMNGLMEFLIASAAERMRLDGIATMSLSGTPLVGIERGDQLEALDAVLGLLARTLEGAYGFASLHRFKQKFLPRERPLLLCAPDVASLPTVGMALARLYLPDVTIMQLARYVRRQSPAGDRIRA